MINIHFDENNKTHHLVSVTLARASAKHLTSIASLDLYNYTLWKKLCPLYRWRNQGLSFLLKVT